MREEKVTCDGCGADLTTRSNSVDYRLVLASESKPGYGPGAYTDMMKYPPVDRTHHFCNLACLDHWRSHENCYAKLMSERWAQWKNEHGREDDDGRVRSYPCPPGETSDGWKTSARKEADKQFPLTENAGP